MQKRTIIALLSLGVLSFYALGVVQNTTIARENTITEERVVSAQADSTELTTDVNLDNKTQTQETSDNQAASVSAIVLRRYNARASWYRHGQVAANGERFNPLGLTAAHKSLPFGTIVRFTNQETGTSVIVRINDRGPFIKGREFDLSLGSARALGIEQRGVATLVTEIMRP